MKGGPKEQVVTNRLDPATERYRGEVFDRARQVSNQPYSRYQGPTVAGPDGRSLDAAQRVQGMSPIFRDIGGQFNPGMFGGGPQLDAYMGAGNVGAEALSGNRDAINRLMNPYQRNVIDALGTEYDRMRDKASLGTNAEATAGGAYGGSRQALLEGERLGALDRAQMSSVADLLHGGYNDMMGRAGAAANLGLGANQLSSGHQLGLGGLKLGAGGLQLDAARGQMDALGQQFGMGDYFRGINQQRMDDQRGQFNEQRDWGLRNLEILKGGASGMPYGNTQSQPLYNNKFNSVAGGAATGFGIGGPWGAAVGGLGGLLFG